MGKSGKRVSRKDRLKKLSEEAIIKLAYANCSVMEIMAHFDLDFTDPAEVQSFEYHWSKAIRRGKLLGNIDIRKTKVVMWRGENGQIILNESKHRLGEHDKNITEISGRGGDPIQLETNEISSKDLSVDDAEVLLEILSRIKK